MRGALIVSAIVFAMLACLAPDGIPAPSRLLWDSPVVGDALVLVSALCLSASIVIGAFHSTNRRAMFWLCLGANVLAWIFYAKVQFRTERIADFVVSDFASGVQWMLREGNASALATVAAIAVSSFLAWRAARAAPERAALGANG